MIFETLVVGPFQCNCYVLGDEKTNEALVIDPGDEVHRIEAVLRKHNLKTKTILHTHAHLDHIGGAASLQNSTNAQVTLHKADEFLFGMLPIQSRLLGVRSGEPAQIDAFVKDGEALGAGSIQLEAIHTPGHTPGSLCFHLPNSNHDLLFSGDTLFMGSIGRTDLWGGSFEDIMASIRERLLRLEDETVVYPGHGPATTIGQERRMNPFVVGA
ncbi:MAG: MBL fold metallo-hydrolase [Nitrospirae bacterium]|nr:MBL fold metallo-hydrolase [Nitrospirota bacterium]